MENQFTQTDVAIVGGGLAGLSAATYLARAGKKVTLFERSASLGGRAASQNHGGYLFNRGIHALYTGGAAVEVLQDLGISFSSNTPKEVFVLRQGKMMAFPTGPSTLVTTRMLDVGGKLELIRMFATLPRMKPQALARMSIQEWLERTFRNRRAQQFMAMFACTNVYSSALHLVSAEVLITKLQLALKHPALYIDGGWQTLVDGLHRAAEQAGVRIVSGTRVETVLHQQGRALGVRLRDGSSITAAAVILATPPKEALKLVAEGAYAPLRQIIDPLIPARVACLDVALRRLPDPVHTIVQDMEHPRFLSTQSLYSRVAPQGGALIYAFKQLDPTHPGDPQEDERDLEQFLDTVQPGWRDVLVKRVYLPHIEAVGMLPTVQAGGYAGRPGPQVPGLANLYLVGDWIGAGFLADPSMGSARQVARLLLQDDSRSTQSKIPVALLQ